MTAAVDMAVLEELRALRAEVATLKLVTAAAVATAPVVRALSMTPGAIRRRRHYWRHHPTKGAIAERSLCNGSPSHDLNARGDLDLDLRGSKKQRSTARDKIAAAKPARKTQAQSDFGRECARLYRGFGMVVRTATGCAYPAKAPFRDQQACHALVSELGADKALQEARELCRNWRPTREFPFPRLALLRFKLAEREQREEEARKRPQRAPAAPPSREGPQPRIAPVERPRASVDGPRPIQGDLAAVIAQARAKAESRGSP